MESAVATNGREWEWAGTLKRSFRGIKTKVK